MPEFTLELAVGDVLVIGNRTLTVIDIDGGEVHFRVDDELSALPLEPGTTEEQRQANASLIYRTKAK